MHVKREQPEDCYGWVILIAPWGETAAAQGHSGEALRSVARWKEKREPWATASSWLL